MSFGPLLRLRIFRVLIPLLLLILGVLLWKSCDTNVGGVHRPPPDGAPALPRGDGISFREFSEGTGESLRAKAGIVQPGEDGSLHLEQIEELVIQREKRGPLVISAAIGDRRSNAEGKQHWHFEKQVEFYEPEQGLRLKLPFLDVDQQAGEARSEGDIRFELRTMSGRASSLFYGLEGQPGELRDLELRDEAGGLLSADQAVMLDGVRDVELIDHVKITRPGQQLSAGKARLIQGPEGRLRQAVVTDSVSGEWAGEEDGPGRLRTDQLDLRWDALGAIEFLRLTGNALLALGQNSLAAATVEVARDNGREEWDIHADRDVYVQGRFGDAPGLIRADQLRATLDANRDLREAEATGRVSFEGEATRAEAERATFGAEPNEGGQIHLFGNAQRKARLAQETIRITGREIQTDVRGERLIARGLVEATLLPGEQKTSAVSRLRLFEADQAIHFVSETFESVNAGARLIFSGSVRGWQGERNLAAGRVTMDQDEQTLEAKEAVTTRIPRESGISVSSADYLQITANELTYDDRTGHAVYSGQVRVGLFEGWLEAQRVEVDLLPENRSIHEIRAFESVRVEFHRNTEGDLARPLSGTSDRLIYSPLDATVRLLGDQSPASVRRIGEGGGTTTGRVLRYRLDNGTLGVESGEPGQGRIRS